MTEDTIVRTELRSTFQQWRDNFAEAGDEAKCSLMEDVLWELDAQPSDSFPVLLTEEQLRAMSVPTPIWLEVETVEGWPGYWCLCQNGLILTPSGERFPAEHFDSLRIFDKPANAGSEGQTK